MTPKVGDVMIIKSYAKNRGKWQLGVITELVIGKNSVIRGAKLRAGKGVLERAVQMLYPLELSCGIKNPKPTLRAQAPEFRPTRNTAAIARLRIQDTPEENELD